MNDQEILLLIKTVLAGGCGAVITWLFDQLAQWKAERKKEISPFTKRWLVIGLAAVVPTVLYIIYIVGMDEAYSWLQNLAYSGTAFMVSQGIHSRKLPTGADMRVAETFDKDAV